MVRVVKASSPMAVSAAASIRIHIEDGTFEPGKPLPSERALSERYGVSRALVREAVGLLNAQGVIHSEPNCRPIVRSKPIRAGRHVGVWLWPQAEDYMASSTFRGIQRRVTGSDLKLVIAATPDGPWDAVVEAERKFLEEMAHDEHAAGAIIWYLGGEKNLDALKAVRETGLPIIFVDRKPPEGMEADYVGTDNSRSAYRGVNYLVQLGHRRIACVTNSDRASSVEERIQGYRRALNDARLPFDPDLFIEMNPGEGMWPVHAERTIDTLMSRADRPTAVFVINDVTALYLLEAAKAHGVRVPEDLAIMGFDGVLDWVPGGGPITTLVQDFGRMGEIAVELLLERFDRPNSPVYRHVLIDAPLSLRSSTAPPQSHDLYTAGSVATGLDTEQTS